jgi:ActR/RegA family two-component response regulator
MAEDKDFRQALERAVERFRMIVDETDDEANSLADIREMADDFVRATETDILRLFVGGQFHGGGS